MAIKEFCSLKIRLKLQRKHVRQNKPLRTVLGPQPYTLYYHCYIPIYSSACESNLCPPLFPDFKPSYVLSVLDKQLPWWSLALDKGTRVTKAICVMHTPLGTRDIQASLLRLHSCPIPAYPPDVANIVIHMLKGLPVIDALKKGPIPLARWLS